MKNWIIGTFLTLVVLIGAAVIAVPHFVDINQYKDKITQEIEKATGFNVVFNDDIALDILPMPHVSAKNIVIANQDGFSDTPLATVGEMEIYVALAPLLSKQVDVQSITLTDPNINLEVNKNGDQNWSVMKGQEGASDASSDAVDKPKNAVTIRRVSIENGRVAYINAGADPIVVSDITITADADSLQGPFDVAGAITTFGQTVSFDTQVKQFDTLDEPLSLALNAKASPADAAIDFEGVIDAKAMEAQGMIAATHPQGKIKGMMNANAKSVTVTDMQATAMGVDAQGNASVSMDPITLKAQVKANGSNIDVVGIYNDALNIVATADVFDVDAFKPAKSAGSALEKNDNKSGESSSGKALPINFDVTIDKLIVQKTPVQSVKAKGTLAGDTLRLSSASVGDYNGLQASASGLIKNIKTLVGLDIKASGDIKTVKTFAEAMKIDTQSIPPALKTVSFDAAVASDNGQDINVDSDIKALGGTYGVKTVIANARTKPVFNGADITINHPNFANLLTALSPNAPQYDTFRRKANIALRFEQNGKTMNIKNLKGSIGNTTLAGNVAVNTSGAKPDIKGSVSFGDLSIQSVGVAKTGGNDKRTQKRSGAKWSSAPINSAWLNSANVDLDIKADRIVYETWDMRTPSIDFTMQNGVLNVKKLQAGLYGGSVALSAVMKAANDKAQGLNVQSDVVVSDVDLEQFAGSFIGTKILKTDGKASLQTKINGAGVSQKALIASLNGNGVFNSDGNITIQGFDVAQFTRAMSLDNKPGDTVSGLFQSAGRSGSTVFNTLKGGFDMTQGVMTLQGVSLDGPSASVASKGNINLPNWTLDTTHTITAKGEGEDLPTFDVVVKGSLDNPAQNIAQGALQNYLQKKLSRKLDSVLTDKLDLGDGDGPIEQKLFNKFVGDKLNKELGVEPSGGNQQQKPANENKAPTPEQAIEGVLKGLFQ